MEKFLMYFETVEIRREIKRKTNLNKETNGENVFFCEKRSYKQ